MMVTAWEIRINWSWSEDDESSYGTFPFNDPLPWVRRLIEGLFYLTWAGLYLDSAAQIKYQSRHLATSSGFLIRQTWVIAITISIFHSWRLMDLVQNVLRYIEFLNQTWKCFVINIPGLRWWVRVSRVEFGAMGQYHLAASLARALGITNWTIIADNNNSMQYHNAQQQQQNTST